LEEWTLVGHVDVNTVTFSLPDGRPLLHDVSLRVGEGAKVALIGPNGTGKTTLTRIIAGDLVAHEGAVTRTGGLGTMRQFVGKVRDDSTVRDLLLSVAPQKIRSAAAEVERTELVMVEHESEQSQMDYAQALVDWGDAGGYEYETLWDVCSTSAVGLAFEKAQWRRVTTLSGGEQKRLVLEALLRGPEEVLLLDEPDNYLDVPGEAVAGGAAHRLAQDRAVRQPRPRAAGPGSMLWVHPGRFETYHQARVDRFARLEELRKRWDEEHAKLKALVVMYRQKAAYNSDTAARLQAAETRLRRFVDAGPPEAVPVQQNVTMRLRGGRTAKRAVISSGLELSGLMEPFDLEIWYGERVAVLGSNGSGKSHFLRLLAAGGSDPDLEHRPVGDIVPATVAHTGSVRLGSRVRPGWFAQTHEHPSLLGRTLLEVLHRGDEHRAGKPREEAARALDRYELARSSEQTFETLSGGQQARFQILLLELSGATLLLLDEPTDNLDLDSAEALEEGLEAVDGTVVAVTHDRWFARGFDRFLVFGADGRVYESDEPMWEEGRVARTR